jgi:penicillin-binding protein 2
MLRREAISTLVAACAAGASRGVARFFDGPGGAALLVDVRARRLIAAHGTAGLALNPPGSTLKPLVLAALLEAGKLRAGEEFLCEGALSIAGRSFNCSHPPVSQPMTVRTALAYSCNCFTAHYAARFESGELARFLERAGLGSRTGLFGAGEAAGRIQPVYGPDATRLQALGESGVLVTAAGMALAYRFLALGSQRPLMQPVLAGLEDAVEYGTAQRARAPGLVVAGKTGSVRAESGARVAWFAGFAPSRAPEVVIAVALEGRSGGGDAAPVAGRILADYKAGRL